MTNETAPPAIAPGAVPVRRFDSAAISARIVPFVLGGGGAIGMGLAGLSPRHPGLFLAGVAFSALLGGLGVLTARRALPSWLDPLMPLLGIVLVGVLRHGAGPTENSLGLLVLIPILWLSMFGTRKQLAVALVFVVVVLAGPILIVGGAEYPASEWRYVGIIVMLAIFVGLTIHALVHDLQAQARTIVVREAAIAAQATLTRAIVDTAFDAIVTLDGKGRIIEWNEAADVALGRSSGDLAGRDFIDEVIAPDRRETVRSGLQRMVALGSSDRERRFETSIIRPDGRIVPVEVTTATTDGPGGIQIHAFARDITDRRLVDEAAARHRADLGRLLSVASELGRDGGRTDGRTAICVAAQELAGADMALFFELNAARGVLVGTGRSGQGPDAPEIELSGKASVTATAFATGRSVFVPDLAADPRIDQTIAVQLGAQAALFQPIVSDDRPLGVLVVYWRAAQERLPDRIASIVALFAAQAAATLDRADLVARLEELARTDPLTGAANRRALEETLVAELAAAGRSGRPLSVMMLDVDHFKAYNDRYGHQAGDRLLRTVTKVWRAELRPSDTLARYGGEEFVVVLPDCDTGTALRIANRLRAAVPGDQTVSAGIAAWSARESMTELIARADAVLYEAKRAGRDRAVVAGPVDDSPATVRVAS